MATWVLRTSALVSIAAAVAVYGLMLAGYRQGWGWLATADAAALNASYHVAVKDPAWVGFWDGVSTIFEPAVFRVLGMAAIVVAVIRRHSRTALFLLAAVETSGMLTALVKGSVGRPRPVTAMVTASSSSFPSGHALGVMIGVGAILVLALPMLGRRDRLVALGAGALVVAVVGVARVALNVHHPSDVVAGWALGWAYLAGWALLLEPWRQSGLTARTVAPQDDRDDQR